jgi:NADPH:quinone reductase-like Zn-dependent oxidoreductase
MARPTATHPTTMTAVHQDRYGAPDTLQLIQAAVPEPGEGEVVIRVRAASVTPSDCAFRSGTPAITRLFNGLRKPKAIPGSELAGTVERLGQGVRGLTVGERVFGSAGPRFGAHAQYACVPAEMVAPTPSGLDDGQAVSIADGPLTALVFLRDAADLQAGQTILVNGASGSVGGAAIQLARHLGAVVTVVCSTSNRDLVASLGADHVIDYTREDFTTSDRRYDVIFDAVGTSSYRRCKPLLEPGGIYLTTAPSLAILWQTLWTSKVGSRRARIAFAGLDRTPGKLDTLTQLHASGALRPVVDRRYPLEEIADAHRYVDDGHKTGTVVVTM